MLYTGDVTVKETWESLRDNDLAVLIDVRTQAEWAFVGICDLSDTGKKPLLVSWQDFPHMTVNKTFADQIAGQHIPQDAPLYFLCRSGVRSQAAAAEMLSAGYEQCFNVIGGFEGDRDDKGHRGTVGGWKASGLPWVQQ